MPRGRRNGIRSGAAAAAIQANAQFEDSRSFNHEKTREIGAGLLLLGAFSARAQWTLAKEQMIVYTAKNPYDRFPDGLPKVPDNLLERVKEQAIEEAWGAVRSGCSAGGGRGGARGAATGANACAEPGCFPNQFSGGWKILNPGRKLVGRAFTVQFMPNRPDVAEAMQAEAEKKGLG